jgi:hypothetical protein
VALCVFAVAVAWFFLVANRGAYKSFYSDDDLDHMGNAREAGLPYYLHSLILPRLGGDANFRSAAHLYYWAQVRTSDLDFPMYIAGIHAIHLINVALVFFLATTLGAAPVGACAAALLFAFSMATFDVFWNTMYVFDLLCATWILCSLIAYVRGHLIVSLICFWLALKSKEIAIALPVVLAGYEYWLGERKWKRILPFFGISVLMGVQAMRENAGRDNDYSLRFTWAAIKKTAKFYSGELLFIPWAGLAVLALPLVFRNRKVWFGVLMFFAFFGMMLVLPGRLFAAYFYLPLAGLAIALSTVTRPLWLVLFFALWIPWNYAHLRPLRRAHLNQANDRRHWFGPVAAFVEEHPDVDTYVYDGVPDNFQDYGVIGALRNLRPRVTTKVKWIHETGAPELMASPNYGLISWDYSTNHSRVEMKHGAPAAVPSASASPPR